MENLIKRKTLLTTLSFVCISLISVFSVESADLKVMINPNQQDVLKLKELNSCEGCTLSGANLSKANLSKAKLSRANLIFADLTEADLT